LNEKNLIQVLSGKRKHSLGWTICKLPLPWKYQPVQALLSLCLTLKENFW
jgi:hypothetical protein